MKKSIAMQWVKLLRSGEFKQATGRLQSQHGSCCLGVLCNIALVEGVCETETTESKSLFKGKKLFITSFDDDIALLPDSVKDWAGMKTDSGRLLNNSLAGMNDRGRKTFKQIADYIEKNWRLL